MNPIDYYETLISADGSSRGTGYIESNKIVRAAGKIHVAWLDAGRGGKEPVRIKTLNLHESKWSPAITLGEAIDNHGGPVLVRDGNGYLHTLFGPHHGPFFYRRSLRPDDASEWTPTEQVGLRCTYPSLVCDADNTLHMVCRDTSEEFGVHLAYYRRTSDGIWSQSKPLIRSTDNHSKNTYRCYRASLFPDRQGVLHLGFMLFGGEHFHNATAQGLAGYLRSADAGNTWTDFDGTVVEDFPTDREFDRVPVKNNCIRTSNLTVDAQGMPCIATVSTGFRGYADKWGEALLWKRQADGWQCIPLNSFIEKVYPGHRASWAEPSLSVAADGRLFIVLVAVDARCVDPNAKLFHGEPTSIYGNPTSRLVMLISSKHDHSFDVFRVGQNVSGVASWIPSLERFIGHNDVGIPALLYTHGITGTGCNPDNISTEIRLALSVELSH